MSNEKPKKSPEKTEKLSQKGECGAAIEKQQATNPASFSANVLKIGCPIFYIGLVGIFIKCPGVFGMYGLGWSLLAGLGAFFPFLLDIYMSDKRVQRDFAQQAGKKLEQAASKDPKLMASWIDTLAYNARKDSERPDMMDKAITWGKFLRN